MFQFNQLSLRKISSLRCLFIYLRILLHFPFRPRSVHVLARDRGSCINKWLGQLSNFHSLAASQTFRISAGFRRKHWIKIIYLYDIWNRYLYRYEFYAILLRFGIELSNRNSFWKFGLSQIGCTVRLRLFIIGVFECRLSFFLTCRRSCGMESLFCYVRIKIHVKAKRNPIFF